MSARRFKGYRVGIIKPDGARRYMKPRSDGKWSLSETKPIVLDEDEMSDALDDVGDFMVGGDVSFSTPVFATRKPKPAPAEGAVEGRYAVLFGDGSGGYFGVLDKRGNEVASRDVAAEGGENKLYDGKLVRVLDDGALEAACEAARREERERVCADTKKAIEKYVWDHSSVDVTHIYKLLDEAAKGQAK